MSDSEIKSLVENFLVATDLIKLLKIDLKKAEDELSEITQQMVSEDFPYCVSYKGRVIVWDEFQRKFIVSEPIVID